MATIYDVQIQSNNQPDTYRIIWKNIQQQSQDYFDQSDHLLTEAEASRQWQMTEYQQHIGQKLFRFLDGDGRHLTRALAEAAQQGEALILHLRACEPVRDWPFEILADDHHFLLPETLHLIRRVSDWGAGKLESPANRPLKLLFMACSAIDVQPELDFEKEEETIFQVTEKLAIDMEVDDTGSLAGLREQLTNQQFDVIHLSGHADITRDHEPFFVMETETGHRHCVFPWDLYDNALRDNPPQLVFLSGCRTGETSDDAAAMSYAEKLVFEYHVPYVLSWGRSVSDEQAILAEKVIYRELSRGQTLLDAVQRARLELYRLTIDWPHQAWTILRLYSSRILPGSFVQPDQKLQPKARQVTRAYLGRSQVSYLETGFVGRRRPLQASLRALKQDNEKIGLLIQGMGGLGKSSLAGKICERLHTYHLIVVKGRLDAITLQQALRDAFIIAQDKEGLDLVEQAKEMPDKLTQLCTTVFKSKPYLLILDDFEQNLEGYEKGQPGALLPEAVPLLKTLLDYLPLCLKQTQLLITSRYPFTLTHQGQELVAQRLQLIPLASFRPPEQRKKAQELKNIQKIRNEYQQAELIAAGHGNPRLMEWLDQLVGQLTEQELPYLTQRIQNKQQEFIQQHVLRELLTRGGADFEKFLTWCSIYRRPVLEAGIHNMAEAAGLPAGAQLLQQGLNLTLMEKDPVQESFGVAPILREELLRQLTDCHSCHTAAFGYYEQQCANRDPLDPVLSEEWIYHALGCGEEEVAADKGGDLVSYLREHLAYLESKRVGAWVLAEKKLPLKTGNDGNLLYEYAFTLRDMGNFQDSIAYLEQALKVWIKVYGENDGNVTACMNDLGLCWKELSEYKKAIDYYEKALKIDIEIYGDKDSRIAVRLNNLGSTWNDLGEPKKAIGYYEQALAIDRAVFGGQHPNIAIRLHNLGSAWYALDDQMQAIDYYDQALAIWTAVYGQQHPQVATGMINLGLAWNDLGEHQKAIGYCEQALVILKSLYEQHPHIAIGLNNIGSELKALGESKKAIGYYEQALAMFMLLYGEQHRFVATTLNNLGSAYYNIGDKKKARAYFEASYQIFFKFFGPEHPSSKTTAEWLANL